MFHLNNINDFNTISEVEKYRKSINEACDKRVEYINSCLKAFDLGNKSFGFLKECFEAMSEELYKSKAGKNLIGRYISTIKEDKGLSKLYSIYESIRKMNPGSDIDYFINSLNEAISIGKVSEESKKKIGKLVSEAYIMLGESVDGLVPEEHGALDAAVEYIAENKMSMRNLEEYSHAVGILKEAINAKKDKKNMFHLKDKTDKAEKLIIDFNQKYSKELTDEDIEAIKKLSESNDKESIFNQYKKDCIEKLSEAKKNCSLTEAEKMDKILKKVNEKQFCNETVDSDICKLLEINKLF